MNKIRLCFPTLEMETAAEEFKKEFFDAGENTISGSYKFDMNRYSYAEWLQILRDYLSDDTVNPKFGVSETYFALNEDDIIVGIINFRHEMTEFYKNSGHIGYSVRPTQRGKGYATEMLKAVLEKAEELGMQEILLVCKRSNLASARVIVKNEGRLIRSFSVGDEELRDEYCIIVTQSN